MAKEWRLEEEEAPEIDLLIDLVRKAPEAWLSLRTVCVLRTHVRLPVPPGCAVCTVWYLTVPVPT